VGRRGMGLLSAVGALSALSSALARLGFASESSGGGGAVLAAVPIRWQVFSERLQRGARPFFELLSYSEATLAAVAAAPAAEPAGSGAAAPGIARIQSAVEAAVRSIIGADVPADAPLMAAGLDSLGAVELRNALSESLGVTLSATAVFDYPSPGALIAHLAERLGAAAPAVTALGGTLPSHLRSGQQASGEGGAETLAVMAVAAAMPPPRASSGDAIGVVPLERWDVEERPEQATWARFGAFLPDVAAFDGAAFGVSDTEAALMDPQQRLLLTATAQALGAWSPGPGGPGAGVYLGIASSDYGSLVKAHTAAPGALTRPA